MSDGILLVPGFLGFGSFGEGSGSRIAYFDQVEVALATARPALRGWIGVVEPPPTGPLDERVACLWETAARILADGFAGDAARRPDRLHLIGHSTGGLDARLLTNRRFRWPGGPPDTERAALLERIDTVVTVSAPLHGTPLADRLRAGFLVSLPGLYLLSIVATAQAELAIPVESTLLDTVRLVLRNGPWPRQEVATLLLTLDGTTRRDIGRFLANVATDGRLIDDLRPDRVRELEARIAGGDHPRLRHVVSVAPTPSLLSPLGAALADGLDALLFAGVYAAVHEGTSRDDFEPRVFPSGEWLGGLDVSLRDGAPEVNDGIVPASSQALGGRADLVVEADHLDVIGHYHSARRPSVTLFRSGSGFDDARFDALWERIASWCA